MRRIAARVGRSPAQVLLRWALQQGASVLTKASGQAHGRQNAAVMTHDGIQSEVGGFMLTAIEMALLDGLAWFVSSGANRAVAADVYRVVETVDKATLLPRVDNA